MAPFANLRIDALVAPVSVLTNVLGLVLGVALGGGRHGIEATIVAFTYYSNATQIMFEFNQIYRAMESSLTEAAQFTELLLSPPAVVDPVAPEPLRPAASDVRFERVTFAHAGALPLFTSLDLVVPSGTRLGLVGRSGGGKSTLLCLLLRLMDLSEGRILIGGQDISRLRQSDLRSLISGEPLLSFPLVRWITAEAKRMNAGYGKDLAFVIATNLALIDNEMLEFCAEQDVHLSTSLDGPQDLHNGNRRRPGQDSWQQAVAGIARVQERLGPDRISALMTTTEAALGRATEVIDTYADLGLRGVFLRPISPYGFALRGRGGGKYDVDRWLEFYAAGLDRIVELNRRGVKMVEIYASIVAKKMLTNTDPGYVDLTSPAGIGLGALVYNYDGDIYASDEGRMLAEMGDHTFRLGNVDDSSYADVMLSDGLLRPLTESIALSAPMCATCAFEPYCRADPVFHHATTGDFTGHKALSAFCRRNMGVFTLLLRKMRDDSDFRSLMRQWSQ